VSDAETFAERLIGAYGGPENAFGVVNQARKGEQGPSWWEKNAPNLSKIEQAVVDRYLEGAVNKENLGPLAGPASLLGGLAYEGVAKPLINTGALNRVLPEDWRYKEGVSSPAWDSSSLERLKALWAGATR
jgi:hypothetical protein